MPSSTDNADKITTAKEGDSTEDTAAKQLALQIKGLSIENDEDCHTDDITTCAACGKEGEENNMNICNTCKMVHYCNASCKKKHKSEHKKACERHVAELHDGALFKDPPPPEDCPICFLPLPLEWRESLFNACCG